MKGYKGFSPGLICRGKQYAENTVFEEDRAEICSSGDAGKIDCTGQNTVICCAGHGSSVKAKKGCWITLSEWKWEEETQHSIPVCVKTEYVDGERIKEDTFYTLKDGKFVEAD